MVTDYLVYTLTVLLTFVGSYFYLVIFGEKAGAGAVAPNLYISPLIVHLHALIIFIARLHARFFVSCACQLCARWVKGVHAMPGIALRGL